MNFPTRSSSTCVLLASLLLAPKAQAQPAAPVPIAAWQLSAATRARLDEILASPQVSGARVGLEVRLLGRASSPAQFPSAPLPSGPSTLYERDGGKRFLPASNVKMFTVASALKYLGAGFRVSTRVLASGKRQGVVWRGDLFLVGGGDPTLTTRDLGELARALYKRGIRRVQGRIIGDGSALRAETFGGRYPDTWAMDDALWYYGAPISALAIDRNQIDISLAPTQLGQAPRLSTSAPADFPILNRALTVAAKQPQGISIERADSTSVLSNTLSIGGRLAVGERYSDGVAVPDPPRRAAWLLKRALFSLGVPVSGAAQSGAAGARHVVELARHDSPALSAMAAFCLKPSDNLSAEMLLRLTALHASDPPRAGTEERAHSLLRAWLGTISPHLSDARFVDGSGLGRYNLLSPRLCADLLQGVENLPSAEARAFWDALPIAGVDGTLRRRMKTTLAQGNARAKTGSFSIASSLSGYVTTRDGFRLAASFLSSFGSTEEMRKLQDQVFQSLAEAQLEEGA